MEDKITYDEIEYIFLLKMQKAVKGIGDLINKLDDEEFNKIKTLLVTKEEKDTFEKYGIRWEFTNREDKLYSFGAEPVKLKVK